MIHNLVSEGVLEAIFELGEEACLIEQFGRCEVSEEALQFLLGLLGDVLEECEWKSMANDGGDLEDRLLLWWQSVDPGGKNGLDSSGNANCRKGLG